MEKTKKFIFGIFIFLVLLSLFSLASASSFSISGETSKNANHSSIVTGYLTIKNTNSSVNFSAVKIISQNGNLSFSYSPDPFSLDYNEEKNVSYSITVPAHLSPGVYNFNYIINSTNNSVYNETKTGQIAVNVQASSSLQILNSPIVVFEGTNTATIQVKNTGNTQLANVILTIENGTVKYTLLTGAQTINAGETKSYTVLVDASDVGTTLTSYTNNLNATSGSIVASGQIKFEKSYCRFGENSSSYIKITEIEDRSSGDDWEWSPLKEVSLRIEVENRADSSKRVTVKLGLYDTVKGKFVELKEGEKELEQTIRIKGNDEERFNFDFKLPADLKQEIGRYRLYVKAFERNSEKETCDADYKTIEIDFDKDAIAEILEMPSLLSCGSPAFVSLRVFNLNLGDDEKMRVNLYSNELGLNLYSEQFELDEDKDEFISFNFVVPEGKEEKSYRITFYLEYDYRESLDSYRQTENLGVYTVRVSGEKCKPSSQPLISAKLLQGTETKVGANLDVEITITNTLSTQQNIFVSLNDYESWARSASLNETSFVLAPNQSRTIKATFIPTKEGNNEFVVKLIYGINSKEQRVSVSIQPSNKSNNLSFKSILDNNMGDNLIYYLTIAIIILIVLIIIVIVVKFSTKK
ncbi:MAG: putative S-layer protein [Candidatus Pacearchaeota archaeon]